MELSSVKEFADEQKRIKDAIASYEPNSEMAGYNPRSRFTFLGERMTKIGLPDFNGRVLSRTISFPNDGDLVLMIRANFETYPDSDINPRLNDISAEWRASGEVISREHINSSMASQFSEETKTRLGLIEESMGGKYQSASSVGEVIEALKKARQDGASKNAKNDENQSLRQNLMHVPMAIGILTLFVSLEIAQSKKVRTFVMRDVHFRRRK